MKACPAHNTVVVVDAGTTTTTSKAELKKVYDIVLEENQRKNQALAKALEVHPGLADIIDPITGARHDLITVAKQIKQEANPSERSGNQSRPYTAYK